MKPGFALTAFGISALAFPAAGQSIEPMALINKMQSNYRSLNSYKDTAAWTHKVGEKEFKAEISLFMSKPNRYLFEMKGDRLNTLVMCDGKILTAYRGDRQAYTRTTAPATLMRANLLNGVDQPSAGSRIITMLLQANFRDITQEWAFQISKAKVSGPHDFGGRLAYVLSFPYSAEYDVKLYITTGDLLVRRIQLLSDAVPVITEDRQNIERNGTIADDQFVRTLPERAKSVVTLPPLPDYTAAPTVVASSGEWGNAPDFTVKTADGGTITLSSLKGKVVLLNFFFNT